LHLAHCICYLCCIAMGADGNPYDDPYSLPNDVAKVDDEQLSRMGPGEKRRRRCFNWSMRTVGSYLEFGMPGLGMFIEGYIIFASGQTGGLRKALYPACWAKATESGCSPKFVEHYSGYIAIVGVIAGMLLVGAFGDFFGRKWGSRSTAILMLLTTILLTFTPLASTGYGNLAYYTVALTFFGVAVGGEYPMASTSASERAAWRPGMAKNRGRHVALVFSNQGLGTFVNGCVILLGYLFFEQYGSKLSTYGSRAVSISTGCMPSLQQALHASGMQSSQRSYPAAPNLPCLPHPACADHCAAVRSRRDSMYHGRAVALPVP
jgi:hypothetical protein